MDTLQITVLCPNCEKGRLSSESPTEGEVRCDDCNASFPVKDGVIDLLPEYSYERTWSQNIMESQWFIDIYETGWFRKGPFMPVIAGLSFDEEYEVITRAVKIESAETLLDIGCGSGIYSRPIAKKLDRGRVVGFDLSLPMLSYASSKAREEGIENFTLIHGNAMQLPFPDNEFDAAICCATIHLLSADDLLGICREIRRVLKPGGRFATSCLRNWIPGEWAKKIGPWYHKKVGTNYWRADMLEPIFTEAGFEDVECLHAKRYWILMSATKPE